MQLQKVKNNDRMETRTYLLHSEDPCSTTTYHSNLATLNQYLTVPNQFSRREVVQEGTHELNLILILNAVL